MRPRTATNGVPSRPGLRPISDATRHDQRRVGRARRRGAGNADRLPARSAVGPSALAAALRCALVYEPGVRAYVTDAQELADIAADAARGRALRFRRLPYGRCGCHAHVARGAAAGARRARSAFPSAALSSVPSVDAVPNQRTSFATSCVSISLPSMLSTVARSRVLASSSRPCTTIFSMTSAVTVAWSPSMEIFSLLRWYS